VPTTYHLVIPDPAQERVLLVEEASGWALPRVTSDDDWGLVSAIPRAIGERFGLHVVVLRSIGLDPPDPMDEESHDEYRFTENVSASVEHVRGWVTEAELHERELPDERDERIALRWFAEQRGDGPERLEPWQRQGWFAEARDWVFATMPGVTLVEQRSSWNGSAILRIETGDGRFYLKASPGYFRHEGEVTAMLSGYFPDVVPRPAALDPRRGWMILPDFGDMFVGGSDLETWEEALVTMASVHRASSPIIDELLMNGCVDRRPGVEIEQIGRLASGELGPIADGYPDRLHGASARFERLATDLEAASIPMTLVHGDFHPANIAIRGDGYVIFDWTDACIAHPFVDIETYLYTFGPPTTDAAIRDRLLRRYLEEWDDAMSSNDAIELFHRTEPLMAMHHAITYQAILQHLDPSERWQWESHVPWWLDKALDGVS
jgi:hypothetical protein